MQTKSISDGLAEEAAASDLEQIDMFDKQDSLVGDTVEAFLEVTQGEPVAITAEAAPRTSTNGQSTFNNQEDAPPCSSCGSITVRAGSCYSCLNCGGTSGCG